MLAEVLDMTRIVPMDLARVIMAPDKPPRHVKAGRIMAMDQPRGPVRDTVADSTIPRTAGRAMATMYTRLRATISLETL
jgi:hypothetical protein